MALVHRWPLTANANDVVGGLNLVNNGSVTFDPTNGASFNGSQWLSGVCTLTNPFSMSIWLKFPNVSANGGSFVFGDSSGNLASRAGFYHSGASYAFLGTSIYALDFTAVNYPSTSFVLCTITYDGTTLKLYRGITMTVSATTPFVTPDSNLSLGRFGANSQSNLYFTGNQLDARIYSNAIDSQIPSLYSAGPYTSAFRATPKQLSVPSLYLPRTIEQSLF